ncbi:hypothetical protein [Pontitalea aquivivens]|uniref:hypothetical protein n=1 Tax=Pontitalea aquivivens TaxID=3388663 RepID=UPI00397094A1
MTLPAAIPLPLLAPVLLLAVAALALRHPGPRPGALPRLAEAAALTVLALGVAGVMQLFVRGPADTSPGRG